MRPAKQERGRCLEAGPWSRLSALTVVLVTARTPRQWAGGVRSSAWVVEGGEGAESCLDVAGGIHRVLDPQPAPEHRTRGSEAKMLAGGRHTSPGSRSTASRPL